MRSYVISGPDNGQFAYDSDTSERCIECGKIDRKSSIRKNFQSIGYDISYTFDNELVVSKSLYDFLKTRVEMLEFLKAGECYYLIPKQFVEFDSETRKTRFGKKCGTCDSFLSVIGAHPCFLKNEINAPGIYGTDIEFGDLSDSGKTQTPLIIVTLDILNQIRGFKPSGFEFQETRVKL